MTALLKMNNDYGLVTTKEYTATSKRNVFSSCERQRLVFQPAFYDMQTGKIHIARFANGQQAPLHILDGMPKEVAERSDLNLVSGFIYNGIFMTRQQAAGKRDERDERDEL
ncbi:hypothetical protein MNBD_GAMMA12-64 [hydrothermal vent metagenome]|uniref:Uncharacterized protein n=1 Tax=hydrothermal vent metagenome TaxID=652676 RepID=A0A3B0YT64_9ZZZZ